MDESQADGSIGFTLYHFLDNFQCPGLHLLCKKESHSWSYEKKRPNKIAQPDTKDER